MDSRRLRLTHVKAANAIASSTQLHAFGAVWNRFTLAQDWLSNKTQLNPTVAPATAVLSCT